MIKYIKAIVILFFIGSYIIICLIKNLLCPDILKRRKIACKIISIYCKLILKVLNIHYLVDIDENDRNSEASLMVVNHLSYIDIFILSSIKPVLYITSFEIKNDVFLGLMAKMGNVIFVERRNLSTITNDIKEISIAIKNGISVVLFAEATTSDGFCVLPFKSSLFNVVEKTDYFVTPIVLNYLFINNQRVKYSNKDDLFYYNEMKFIPHFWNLFSLKKIYVKVSFLEKVIGINKTRKEICKLTYNLINKNYLRIH